MRDLDLDIHRAAATFAAAFTAGFAPLAVAAALLAALAFRGRINRALQKRCRGLRLNMRNRARHYILRRRAGHDGRWYGGDLHGQIPVLGAFLHFILTRRNERIFNNFVSNYASDTFGKFDSSYAIQGLGRLPCIMPRG
jgi:hypothetical protein